MSLRFDVPDIQISLHFGVSNNQISLHFGVSDNQISLHLDVPDNCSLTPLEEWGKAGACRKVPLPKLRNTGASSTNWKALLYCTSYTVQFTLSTVIFSHPPTLSIKFFQQTFP